MMAAPLPHDETLSLLRQAHDGDADAEEQLVTHNSALVKSIVKKYLGRGVDFDDLFQIGSLGLVKAIKNYSEEYGVRFSTYAVPMIAGEIKRFLRDDGMVKVSRSLKEVSARASMVREALRRKNGADPNISEIAAVMNIEVEELVFALDSARAHVSLYEPIYDDDSSLLLIDRMEETEGDSDEAMVDRLLLKDMLRSLEPKERQIIILRYFKDKTQSEIARAMGVSQVQISRLETRILKKLRDAGSS